MSEDPSGQDQLPSSAAYALLSAQLDFVPGNILGYDGMAIEPLENSGVICPVETSEPSIATIVAENASNFDLIEQRRQSIAAYNERRLEISSAAQI